jgi:tryptophan synthase alpha chain
MSRIAERFESLNTQARKGFIPFITAGDPDLSTSLLIMQKLAELGADVIELGVPFSDPMADGPTIQRSSMRALKNGVSLADVIELAARFRNLSDVPVVLFSYFNPILKFGIDEFVAAASKAGIDGVLLTDVIEDEAAAISATLAGNDIDLISLIAPTTSEERLRAICVGARGFVYAVARAGVTGASDAMTTDAETLVARARQFTDMPMAVGFGISTPEQIAQVWEYADAAVVGSAIVNEIEQGKTTDEVVARVERFVTGLLPTVAKMGAENLQL